MTKRISSKVELGLRMLTLTPSVLTTFSGGVRRIATNGPKHSVLMQKYHNQHSAAFQGE